MNCAQYRRSLLANPRQIDTDMRLHAAGCPACTGYALQVRKFEDRLQRAFRVAVEARSGSRGSDVKPARPWVLRSSPGRASPMRWLALAASVVVAVVVVASLWLGASERSLAADVVGHMSEEPDAWLPTDRAVPAGQLEAVLLDAKLRLRADAGLVTYANSCSFRGHQVPHLVVQTASGPVAVMVLTHEAARIPMHFDEGGYRGLIVPLPHHGSMALLEQGSAIDGETVDAMASKVRRALDWRG
jgi:hypothetical protein